MRPTAGWKPHRAPGLHALLLGALALLGGCPTPPERSASSTAHTAPHTPADSMRGGHEGLPYDIVGGESLVTIAVYRAGPLAHAGHNHLIATRDLSGTVYVPADAGCTSFELRMPVAGLSVDDAQLRAAEGSDFPPEVPPGAIEGTRRNMLGPALLDSAEFPAIVLGGRVLGVDTAAHEAQVELELTVRGERHAVRWPVHFELDGALLSVSGGASLKQSELGLTPFSALMGALQVQDEMRIRFRIIARRAPT